jgi:hypothetical protein
MKSIIFSLAALVCLQFTTPVYSQSTTAYNYPASPSSVTNYLPDNIARLRELNEQAYKTFTTTFKSPGDVRISADGENVFVYCINEGIQTKILYNKKGKQVYRLKYYEPSQLPAEVTDIIKEEFSRYTILHGTHVTNEKGSAFLVNISYKNKFKTIRIVNDQFSVYSQYNSQQ